MNNTHDDEELAARLRALPREAETPPRLEERVIGSLRGLGLMRRSGWHRWARPLVEIAAGVALFFAGMAVGRLPVARASAGRQFVLLLYEDTTFRPDGNLVAEYTAWGREVAATGRRISGEKLGSEARLLSARKTWVYDEPRDVTTLEGVLAGFFVLQAETYEDAVAIARAHPHLRYGGRIVVRAVEPT